MAHKNKSAIEAAAYMRTSSSTNVGADKDSDKRQRAAITAFAKASGYAIVDEFYDAAVKGSDPVAARPGFAAPGRARGRGAVGRFAGNEWPGNCGVWIGTTASCEWPRQFRSAASRFAA